MATPTDTQIQFKTGKHYDMEGEYDIFVNGKLKYKCYFDSSQGIGQWYWRVWNQKYTVRNSFLNIYGNIWNKTQLKEMITKREG